VRVIDVPMIMGDRLRVLLVDDNAEILERAAAVLSPTFEIVGAVTNGCAALEAARTLRPQVIVLDISMADMCGLEVAARLKAAGSTAAVVFLTIHDDEEFVVAAKNAGGMGYVLKPRLAKDLPLATLSAGCGRRFSSPQIPSDLW
jgi:DNA-binding NarL/FixJ family response regulator